MVSDNPDDYQHKGDNEDGAEAAAREAAPIGAMGPNRQDTDRHKQQDDQKPEERRA